MAYGRQAVMDALRMAGSRVRDFDDAYAAKLAEYIGGFNTNPGSLAQYAQMSAGTAAGIPALRRFDMGPMDNTMPGIAQGMQRVGEYALPALNAGVRYGLPIAAGAGVANLIGRGYDALSEVPVVPGELPM